MLAVAGRIAAFLWKLNQKHENSNQSMQNATRLPLWPLGSSSAILAIILFAGCQSSQEQSPAVAAKAQPAPAAPSAPAAAPASAAAPAPAVSPAPAVAAASALPPPPVHIKAGPSASFKDSDGNEWLLDRAFADGETAERPDIAIANTKTPEIYRSERYSMTSFSYPVPNGKYMVKLHFCETYEGITGPGERVFSFNVQGHEFKDFDVWVKSGGALRAYVETVPVEVTSGKIEISFTPKVENPQINGIEILPAQ